MIINPQTYQIAVIAKALDLYGSTGIMVNRMYTPKNMMLMAEKITGKKFGKRDYKAAAAALRMKLQ